MLLHRLRQAASAVALALCFALAAAILLPALLGYQRYVITSGSMTGTYDRGSIVYDKPVPTSGVRVGDVITYRPPRGMTGSDLITHRVVWAGRDRDGARAFRTKGDANRIADPWQFTLDRPTQARVAFHVPYVGYVLAALAIREVRMVAIGLPALLVALLTLARLWTQAGAELRRRAAAASSAPH